MPGADIFHEIYPGFRNVRMRSAIRPDRGQKVKSNKERLEDEASQPVKVNVSTAMTSAEVT